MVGIKFGKTAINCRVTLLRALVKMRATCFIRGVNEENYPLRFPEYALLLSQDVLPLFLRVGSFLPFVLPVVKE